MSRALSLTEYSLAATTTTASNPLEVVGLTRLMERSEGKADVLIALIDGPVAISHPVFADAHIREIPRALRGFCSSASSAACAHGTYVAGILGTRRGSPFAAICPGCTLLVRPIFAETTSEEGLPSAAPGELAEAVIDAVDAGARVINVSAALARISSRDERELKMAFEHALRHGVIVVAAAGNEPTVGGSILARQAGVIPVIATDVAGRPMSASTLGHSIARHGLRAPGTGVTGVGSGGEPLMLSGTSVAAPLVSGTIALLWSEFPDITVIQLRREVTQSEARRRTVVPPLLDAWAAYRALAERAGEVNGRS